MRTFIIGLLIIMSAELTSAPITHSVTYNSTSAIACSIGDTLKFYAANAAVQGIQINSITVIAPAFHGPSSYIGYYVIIGGESSYTFYNNINTHIDHTASITLIETNTGIFANATEADFKVFPNPAAQTVTINSDKEINLEFYTCDGKKIFSHEIHQGINEINIGSFCPGTYVLRINSKSTKLITY